MAVVLQFIPILGQIASLVLAGSSGGAMFYLFQIIAATDMAASTRSQVSLAEKTKPDLVMYSVTYLVYSIVMSPASIACASGNWSPGHWPWPPWRALTATQLHCPPHWPHPPGRPTCRHLLHRRSLPSRARTPISDESKPPSPARVRQSPPLPPTTPPAGNSGNSVKCKHKEPIPAVHERSRPTAGADFRPTAVARVSGRHQLAPGEQRTRKPG